MPRVNINQGAPGNPLDALLGGRSMFGTAGGMLYPDAQTLTNGSPDSSFLWNDPRYFEQYITPGSEGGGGETRYRLNQATQNALNGRVQLRNTNIGGPGEAIDPSQVTYDPQFGLVTGGSNVTPSDTRGDWLPWALAAIPAVGMAYGAMTGGGAGGAAGGASGGLPESYWGMNAANGTTVGAEGSGLNGLGFPEMSGPGAFDSGIGGVGGGVTPSLYGGAIGPNTIMGRLAAAVSLPGSSTLSNLGGGLLSNAISNPLQAAGLIQAAGGLLGHHGPSSSSSSSGGGSKAAGGTGVPSGSSIQRPQFIPNQNTAAQLTQLYGGRFQ